MDCCRRSRSDDLRCCSDIESELDADHRLILKSSLPLLKSRNSGVVLGVCALHYYCGTRALSVFQQIGKALVRILRGHREVQFVVLKTIKLIAADHADIFVPYFSDFFVKPTDPLFNK